MAKLFIPTLAACVAAMPAFGAAPAIAAHGVKNAASYADPQLPNGSIAEGSIFNIFGSNMGPSKLAYAAGLPLPITLSGTSIDVTVGGATVQCFMFYTSAGQVAAILPSTTPVGTGTITVSYNGTPSAAAPITVAKSSFGMFTVNQQGSGPGVILDGRNNVSSTSFAFQPGETVVAWGTGLGPIGGSDATTPPSGNLPGVSVSVTVGGQAATVVYAGRSGYAGEDQIDFTIPAGVTGCSVPVAIAVSGTNGANPVYSNTATMSVGTTTTCSSSTSYPPGFLQALRSGFVRVGAVLLAHSVSTSPGTTTITTTDAGEASFAKISSNAYSTSGLDLNYGACAITNSPPAGTIVSSGLDAGPVINVNGSNGAKTLTRLTGTTGSFFTTLGGGAPLPGQTAQPLYLSPGTYTVDNGSGGKDVGGFQVNVTVPPVFTWTNYSSITSVPRSQPLTVTWTGGDPNLDVYLFGSSAVADNAAVSFECRAHGSAGTLTVSTAILQALPPSASPLGALQMLTGNAAPLASNPTGLDLFDVGYSIEYSKFVSFQ